METGVVSIQEPVFRKTSGEEAPALDHSTVEVGKVNLSSILDDEITRNSSTEVINGSGDKEKGEGMKQVLFVSDVTLEKAKEEVIEEDGETETKDSQEEEKNATVEESSESESLKGEAAQISHEDNTQKTQEDTESHEHVPVRDIPQVETFIPKAETVNEEVIPKTSSDQRSREDENMSEAESLELKEEEKTEDDKINVEVNESEGEQNRADETEEGSVEQIESPSGEKMEEEGNIAQDQETKLQKEQIHKHDPTDEVIEVLSAIKATEEEVAYKIFQTSVGKEAVKSIEDDIDESSSSIKSEAKENVQIEENDEEKDSRAGEDEHSATVSEEGISRNIVNETEEEKIESKEAVFVTEAENVNTSTVQEEEIETAKTLVRPSDKVGESSEENLLESRELGERATKLVEKHEPAVDHQIPVKEQSDEEGGIAEKDESLLEVAYGESAEKLQRPSSELSQVTLQQESQVAKQETVSVEEKSDEAVQVSSATLSEAEKIEENEEPIQKGVEISETKDGTESEEEKLKQVKEIPQGEKAEQLPCTETKTKEPEHETMVAEKNKKDEDKRPEGDHSLTIETSEEDQVPTIEAEHGDESSSALPVVEILQQLQSRIKDSAASEENMIIEPSSGEAKKLPPETEKIQDQELNLKEEAKIQEEHPRDLDITAKEETPKSVKDDQIFDIKEEKKKQTIEEHQARADDTKSNNERDFPFPTEELKSPNQVGETVDQSKEFEQEKKSNDGKKGKLEETHDSEMKGLEILQSTSEKNNTSEKIESKATKEIYQEESKQTDTVAFKEEIKETTTQECFNADDDDATEKPKPGMQEIENLSSVIGSQDMSKLKDEVPKLENIKIEEELQQRESEPTVKEPARKSLSDLIQKVKGTNQSEDKTTEPLQIDKEAKTEEEDEEKDDKASSDSMVMVEAKETVSIIKTQHKKSQGILSGVGSKVKHSISKVKKALTGKSSHTKPSSPPN